jgi:crossover junction endodeoxyribonuclease RuvC
VFNAAVGITVRQFEQLQNRTRSGPVAAPASTPPRVHSIILGIDPSLRGTGFGVLRLENRQPVAITHGTVRCPAGWSRSRCLAEISRTIKAQITALNPTACVVEGLFFAQNIQTALIMGEARGASLVAAAESNLEIFEIAPRRVKQAIVGYGAAQKLAVARMVQRMLNLPEPPAPDAADALALALAYAHSISRYSIESVKRI